VAAPGQRRIRHWRTEDFADHHRDLPGPLTIRWAQLIGGVLGGGDSRLLQRTLLRIAEHQRGQLLAAGISEQPDQPRREGINDKHHASSLPATVRSAAFSSARVTAIFFTAICANRLNHDELSAARLASSAGSPRHLRRHGPGHPAGDLSVTAALLTIGSAVYALTH
jgi:hypothetical protein